MRKTWALVWRELIAYFSSPLAYVVMTAFLFINGYVFWLIVAYLNDPRTQAMAPLKLLFGGTIFFWLFVLFVVPVITMRLLAEERRSGTLEVLLTAPVSETQVVIAKFLSAFAFYVVLWLPTLAYVAILASYSKLDWGPVAAGYLGIALLGGLFLSIGLFTSALVRNQILAAILAFALLVVVFSLGLVENLATGETLKGMLGYMNLWNHMDDYARGILDTRHVVYSLSLCGLFLFLATKALEASKGR
ncbi:MAG: ABC transporter permease [Thermoanaerobaculaceae bacterium]|nr:ABC transporter permease [Thermoanaerobaculaceae bacterium]MDI9623161.1 ABC transporter permease [Acidobacteriota bacterium]NLH09966.1 ABC transporter permease [Holophagae bacterium]HPW54525.1 ABC transporter permease [Thermoanaerobaculaceae bacterium]